MAKLRSSRDMGTPKSGPEQLEQAARSEGLPVRSLKQHDEPQHPGHAARAGTPVIELNDKPDAPEVNIRTIKIYKDGGLWSIYDRTNKEYIFHRERDSGKGYTITMLNGLCLAVQDINGKYIYEKPQKTTKKCFEIAEAKSDDH
ncbi:hypothetical protein F4777DRAFT_582302 [Nemania sp. FL0916]|nr:hypothetical protein F4777DRAFT_582302 [Nemania sp. FL0916]